MNILEGCMRRKKRSEAIEVGKEVWTSGRFGPLLFLWARSAFSSLFFLP